MPWETNPKGWYAFARGSYITLKKGPKYWNAEVSVYREDALDGMHHRFKLRGKDRESVALKALGRLRSTTGKRPVQIDLAHGDSYPVEVRTEDDEIEDVVSHTMERIDLDTALDKFVRGLGSSELD